MSLVVFRADGGPAIGAGHVMRCLALAAAFEDAGWSIGFAASANTFQSVRALGVSRYEKLRLPEVENAEVAAMSQHWPAGADVLVVDHYGRDAEFERACRPWARRIVVIDDLADRSHDADFLVDGASSETSYSTLVPANCAVLAGPRYAIVHPSFLQARPHALARRQAKKVDRVLVSIGQTDPANVTAIALSVLDAVEFGGNVDVALGSAAANLPEIQKDAGGRIKLHLNAMNMAALMTAADVAIGAGGVTSWERCCLGLPSVVVTVADNQRTNVANLIQANAALSAGGVDPMLPDRIGAGLRTLLLDREKRIETAEAAASLIDGEGPRRIVRVVV